MLFLAQIAAAGTLITLTSVVMLIWFATIAASFAGGLLPWADAGAAAYGPFVVAVACLPGALGVLWVQALRPRAPAQWQRSAVILVRIGTTFMAVGLLAAGIVFVKVVVLGR